MHGVLQEVGGRAAHSLRRAIGNCAHLFSDDVGKQLMQENKQYGKAKPRIPSLSDCCARPAVRPPVLRLDDILPARAK